MKVLTILILIIGFTTSKAYENKPILSFNGEMIFSQKGFYPFHFEHGLLNNCLYLLDITKNTMCAYDLLRGQTQTVKISDKVRFHFIPKDDSIWTRIDAYNDSYYSFFNIFKNSKTQECYSEFITLKKMGLNTLGKEIILNELQYDETVSNDKLNKLEFYPRGANIAFFDKALCTQGMRKNSPDSINNDFIVLQNIEDGSVFCIKSYKDIEKSLNKNVTDEYAGWTYFLDSNNIFYYRLPDIQPFKIELSSSKITFLKPHGALATIKPFIDSKLLDSVYSLNHIKITPKYIVAFILKKDNENNILGAVQQYYDKNNFGFIKEEIIVFPEKVLKELTFTTTAGDDLFYYFVATTDDKYKIYSYQTEIHK